MRPSKFNKEITIIDLLFNITTKLLLVFCALFVLTALLINPKTDAHVQPKAEYMITMSWPDKDPNDIDLWIQDPTGNLTWYAHKDSGLVTLERDNRGIVNNSIEYDGGMIDSPERYEVVTVRGIIPGTWVVNVQFYEQFGDPHDVPVVVKMVKLNPYQEIFTKKVILHERYDEKTIYSFKMNQDGSITDMDENFISLIDENNKRNDQQPNTPQSP